MKRGVTMEKMKKMTPTLLFVGIVVLGIMNLNLNSRISNLERSIQFANNSLIPDIRGLYSMQQDISNKIDSMNAQVALNAKLSFDEAILVKSYHEATSSAEVDVSFSLKQFGEKDVVNVIARGMSGKTFDAIAVRSGSGRLATTMTLPVQDNYILSFTANGEANISGELTKLNLAEELRERFKYSFGTGQTSSSDERQIIISLYPEFSNNTQGNNALKVKELFVVVESGNTLVGTWDLLPHLQNESNIQIVNDYRTRLQIASGDISASGGNATPQNIIEFIMPDEGATTRLVIVDNMGVRYEQTDRVYAGSSPYSSAGGGVGYSHAPARIAKDGEYGDGYIHFVRQK